MPQRQNVPRCFLQLFVVLALTPFAVQAQDETREKIFSGPQVGEPTPPFTVIEVSKSGKAKKVRILDAERRGPTFVVFVHKISRPALGLIITLERYTHKQSDLQSHFVFLTGDKQEAEQQMKRFTGLFASSPMCVSVDGIEGPGSYGLNRNADMTVLVVRDNKVVHNFAVIGPNDTDAQRILETVARTLGQPIPSIGKLRDEAGRARRRRVDTNSPIYKLAPAPDLGTMMMYLVNPRVTAEDASGITLRLQSWAGNDEKKQAQLVSYSKAVLEGDFQLNRYARESLKKLTGEK